jgi:hypothetical protein
MIKIGEQHMGFVSALCRIFSRSILQIMLLVLVCSAPGELIGQSIISGINWFPIGPADFTNGQTYGNSRVNSSGRASVIAVNPRNPNDVWLGSATGGV